MKKLALRPTITLLPVIPLGHMGSRDSDPALLPTHTHFPLSDGEITLGAEPYKSIRQFGNYLHSQALCSLVFPPWCPGDTSTEKQDQTAPTTGEGLREITPLRPPAH